MDEAKNNNKIFYDYAEGVASGKIIAGRLVRLAVERFYSFLERDDLEFREAEVSFIYQFFLLLKHFKNKHAGKPFVLEPWQYFAIANIYGFYYKGTDIRVCENVYIEIARKNGKTAFAGGLALYHLVADGVAGAEVDLAANSKEQAKISFEFASKFSESLNGKGKKVLDAFRDRVKFQPTDSKMLVFAADASKLDGFGASAFILDEYHAARTSELKDVLQSSQADRENPMAIIITTAGFDKMSPCFQHRSHCVDILEGLVEDDKVFSLIFSFDTDDEWTNEAMWIKTNPNLGVTVRPHFLAGQVRTAKAKVSEQTGILTKNFNMWCDSVETWISDNIIRQQTRTLRYADFIRSDDMVYIGIDLSATSDLTAVSYLIPRAEGMYFFTDYYLPEEALHSKPLKESYKQWHKAGDLKITNGNVVDYDLILADILRNKTLGGYISKLAYDPYNATQFVINATNEGLPTMAVSQSLQNFNKPTKELERLILKGSAFIDNNSITRFCFRNVRLKRDHNDNVKPDKSNAEKKIDGVIAMLQALAAYFSETYYDYGI